ncbi:MAG TPA: hypothetical protein VMB52_03430 [Verrucomicrobiae bacterium]|nr:hypothetical protein [Verrucomicrobiae bacterium]
MIWQNLDTKKAIRLYVVTSTAVIILLLVGMIYACVTLYQVKRNVTELNKNAQATNTNVQMLINKLGDED